MTQRRRRMGNYYSYKRISTAEDRELQTYKRQEAALEKYAAENGIEYLVEFKEDASGKNFEDRKEWNKLEKVLQQGDTVVFKDISRFTRESEVGYKKYMELLQEKKVDLIFLDNSTVSTPYIKELLHVAEKQELVAKTTLENTVTLLLIVELDRAAKERETLIKRIKDGIAASDKKSGRRTGSIDKMSKELEKDIKAFLEDRNIRQVDLMNKHKISRNTLKKYIAIVKESK